MKLKVQVQHLQPGDIVGSGEKIMGLTIESVHWSTQKVSVHLSKNGTDRYRLWGKYTMINVERKEE